MKNIISFIAVFSFLIFICAKCEDSSTEIDLSKSLSVHNDINEISVYDYASRSFQSTDEVFDLLYDGSIVKKGEPLRDRKKISVELIASNSNYDLSNSVKLAIDTILKELYTGIELEFNPVTHVDILETVDTDDYLNSERIISQLVSLGARDDSYNLHVYLFDYSSFFKTSNAFAFNSGGHSYIFGNHELLNNPMLFIHELGHAFNLSHMNKTYMDRCNLFNIMHESNIGCARLWNVQQSIVVGKDVLVNSSGEADQTLPINEGTVCRECDKAMYSSKFEQYLYSRDRPIDEESLVLNLRKLPPKRILKDIINGTLENEDKLRDNFLKEYRSFFKTDTLENFYVDNAIETTKTLRKNNLIRLLGENHHRLNPMEDELDMKEIFTTKINQPLFLDTLIGYSDPKYHRELTISSDCNKDSLSSQLSKLNSIIESMKIALEEKDQQVSQVLASYQNVINQINELESLINNDDGDGDNRPKPILGDKIDQIRKQISESNATKLIKNNKLNQKK